LRMRAKRKDDETWSSNPMTSTLAKVVALLQPAMMVPKALIGAEDAPL
jgi:hypothetical protein